MKTVRRGAPWIALLALLGVLSARPAPAEEYFSRYGLTPASPALDLGTQPLGYPSGVISAVMRRDRLLQAALAAAGHPLKAHPFRRGADMVGLLGDQRLEAGLLGDMPTILAAATGNVWIVGLVKQTSTAIVAGGDAVQVRALAGRRIGYVPVSSAHSTLLQGLASAGLSEHDVRLVPLDIDQMPDALARGTIDAFAAWEPAPALALARDAHNRIVFRGLSTDYFVIERSFEQRAPDAARLLVAGFVRAIEWLRRSQKNAENAARWVLADGAALAGQALPLAPAQIVAITRRDILNVPSAPAILVTPAAPAPLQKEFDFLRRLGKLPGAASADQLAAAFGYDGLARILADPRKYDTRVFDYAE